MALDPRELAEEHERAHDDEERAAAVETRARELGLQFFRISGVTGAGLPELLEAVWRELAAARETEDAVVTLPGSSYDEFFGSDENDEPVDE